MNRTEELRNQGARDRSGSGGGSPFVKWPQDGYAYVEGEVLDVWEGKFGESVTMRVTEASPGLKAGGKNEDGEQYQVTVAADSEVNVGLNYAALKGSISQADRGSRFHIAFGGWEFSKAGDRYRVFDVLELPGEREVGEAEGAPEPDDGLPF